MIEEEDKARKYKGMCLFWYLNSSSLTDCCDCKYYIETSYIHARPMVIG